MHSGGMGKASLLFIGLSASRRHVACGLRAWWNAKERGPVYCPPDPCASVMDFVRDVSAVVSGWKCAQNLDGYLH